MASRVDKLRIKLYQILTKLKLKLKLSLVKSEFILLILDAV